MSDKRWHELAALPSVEAVKLGTRDLAQYELDVQALRSRPPSIAGSRSCSA